MEKGQRQGRQRQLRPSTKLLAGFNKGIAMLNLFFQPPLDVCLMFDCCFLCLIQVEMKRVISS